MKFALFFLFLFFACMVPALVRGQYATGNFILYTVKNGLSDNQVTSLQQDDAGYLWIGTKAGLNRFDGSSFHSFFQGNAPLNLPSDFITRLKKFQRNTLGVFTRGGFDLLHTDTYKVTHYHIADSTAFTTPLNAVWDAVQLPGKSFAITSAAGFYVMNDKKLEFRHDAFTIHDMGRRQMLYGREIFNTGNNNYILYTGEDGQAFYNSAAKTFTAGVPPSAEWNNLVHPHHFPGDRWLIKMQVSDHEYVFMPIKQDSLVFYNSHTKTRVASPLPVAFSKEMSWESQLAMGGDSLLLLNSGINGFYRLFINRQSGTITADEKKYLPEYHITCLFTDRQNRLWAGTSHGVLQQQLTPPPITAISYSSGSVAGEDESLTCVYRYKNIIYTGQYSRHHGLHLIDAATLQPIKAVQFYGNDVAWNEIMSISMYHKDTLWVGTWAGLLWYDTKNGHYGKVLDEKKYPWAAGFPAILGPLQPDGYAWFCAYLGGRAVRYHIATRSFTLFSPQTNPALPFEKVKSIVYDSYGDTWIGGHALTRWSNRLQRFDTVIKVYAGTNKFNDDILSLSADENGSLWFHNSDNGLLQYRIREKHFVHYGADNGLTSASLSSLSRVVNNQLWIAGNNHLFNMNTRTGRVTVYGHNDGLPERIPTSRRIYFDPVDSMMFLCSENFLVRFPLNPEKTTDSTAELLIEELTVNNEQTTYWPGDTVQLNYTQNNLGFHFTVVDFENGNYQFAYRLNQSGAWNNIGSQHNLSFNNLSPGKYLVEISATGKSGVATTQTLQVNIQPPLWARAWFIVLMVGAGLGICTWIFRARLQMLRQKAIVDRQLSRTEMKALQAQMNPHFIFNSLNSIQEMILSQNNREASFYLGQFAQLIRITLEQSTQELVLLRTTIDYLHRYIEMENIRNAMLVYTISTDSSVDEDETLVPPMIIQPFVENAVWHGVSATSKDIAVNISFTRKDNLLLCTVEDNGRGVNYTRTLKRLDNGERRQHGIANVAERLKLLSEKYEVACSVTVTDKQDEPGSRGTGTIVRILLPYQTTES